MSAPNPKPGTDPAPISHPHLACRGARKCANAGSLVRCCGAFASRPPPSHRRRPRWALPSCVDDAIVGLLHRALIALSPLRARVHRRAPSSAPPLGLAASSAFLASLLPFSLPPSMRRWRPIRLAAWSSERLCSFVFHSFPATPGRRFGPPDRRAAGGSTTARASVDMSASIPGRRRRRTARPPDRSTPSAQQNRTGFLPFRVPLFRVPSSCTLVLPLLPLLPFPPCVSQSPTSVPLPSSCPAALSLSARPSFAPPTALALDTLLARETHAAPHLRPTQPCAFPAPPPSPCCPLLWPFLPPTPSPAAPLSPLSLWIATASASGRCSRPTALRGADLPARSVAPSSLSCPHARPIPLPWHPCHRRDARPRRFAQSISLPDSRPRLLTAVLLPRSPGRSDDSYLGPFVPLSPRFEERAASLPLCPPCARRDRQRER